MIRYFAYIDIPTIESFYNQLENSYNFKKVNIEKANEIGGELKISLFNVIRGFFTGEGTLKATHSKLSSEELELINSIETKIEKILKTISANEMCKLNIGEFSENRKLICGTINIIEQKMFLKKIAKLYHKKFKTYEDFLSDFYKNKNISDNWKKVKNEVKDYNGVGYFDIMDAWINDNEKIITFIVVDNKYPISMSLSNKKITMPHSDLTSSGLFMKTTKFHVLGITNKIDNVYTLKPLAMWKVMDDDECRYYVYDERFW